MKSLIETAEWIESIPYWVCLLILIPIALVALPMLAVWEGWQLTKEYFGEN